jgi:hypothetical protein
MELNASATLTSHIHIFINISHHFQVLFGRFYVNEYIEDHKKRQQEKKKLLSNNNVETIKNKNVTVNGKKHE